MNKYIKFLKCNLHTWHYMIWHDMIGYDMTWHSKNLSTLNLILKCTITFFVHKQTWPSTSSQAVRTWRRKITSDGALDLRSACVSKVWRKSDERYQSYRVCLDKQTDGQPDKQINRITTKNRLIFVTINLLQML